MAKKNTPLSLRLAPEVNAQLEDMAARVGIKKHKLAQIAIEAAVKAIANHGGRLSVPVEFEFLPTYVPRPRREGSPADPIIRYGAPQEESSLMAEEPPPKPVKKGPGLYPPRK